MGSFGSLGLAADTFQNTNPERGRKQKNPDGTYAKCSDFRTRTPKGDGNFFTVRLSQPRVFSFQNTNPERGRKRRKICDIIKAQSKKFQNTNPERGRKRGRQGSYPVGNLREFQNTNPGRGRKQLNFVQVHVTYPLFQNTNPGRGRKFDARFELCGRDSPISEHEPRKGTETFLQCV